MHENHDQPAEIIVVGTAHISEESIHQVAGALSKPKKT